MTKKQKKMLCRIIISAILVLAIYFLLPQYSKILYLVPYLVIGYDILVKAFYGIKNLQPFDENFLMSIATIGAMVLGEYTEGVAVMLFYQIGELFQSYAVGKSRRSIASLMDIRPDVANVVINGEIVETDPDEVETASEIVIRAGEKVPIDGIVISGTSSLDTSALTGESMPRDVTVGDEIQSGVVNLSGVIHIKTTRAFCDSTVSKILELVENASSRKSRSERFISRFARYYTPIVCVLSLIIALLPPLVLAATSKEVYLYTWIYRALTFLVISCPCALVISIPLGFFACIGGASRQGILIKGSSFIEALSKAKIAVFDKTGTLTEGKFKVVKIDAYGMSADELLSYAVHAECLSTHPVSRSVVSHFGGEIDKSKIRDIEEISGKGVTAVIDGKKVAVGNRKLMESIGVSCPEFDKEGSHLFVAVNGVYSGCITLSDVVRPCAKSALTLLKKLGIKKTVMLTGDSESAARAVAGSLLIDETRAGLLPHNKVEAVEEIIAGKNKGESVIFIGDGINDAPVLAGCDVGIAMGGIGSDAAIEAADVILMDDNIEKAARAVQISKKCMSIVYQNIVFAIGIKVLCLILGAFGLANMWLAIFADVGVMVLAVLNAIRTLKT